MNIWQHVKSSELVVGDIVRLDNGQEIPADCIVLSCTSTDGTCFINTSQLDGFVFYC